MAQDKENNVAGETPEASKPVLEQNDVAVSAPKGEAGVDGKIDAKHLKKRFEGVTPGTIANKVKSMGRKQKLLLAVVLMLIIAGVAYFATVPPYVGTWYSEHDDEPFMEIRRDGTAVVNYTPEASVTWKELENGDIKLSILDFSDGEAEQSTFSMEYGKTNNGMEYLSDTSGTVLFKSADDFKRIEESSKKTDLDELSNKNKDSDDEDEDDYDW